MLKGERIVSASVDIPAGAVITMQMLVAKEVPDQFIPAQAIQGVDQVKQILVAVRAGQILLWSDLVSEQRGGVSAIIPEGEGAYTLTISKGANTTLIQPSDHIDIIGSVSYTHLTL